MLEMQGTDQEEERFTGRNKGHRLPVRGEFEIETGADITRYHTVRQDRPDVEFSYFCQALPSVCICDPKQAKVSSVLLITGADIHIRPGITQRQQRETQTVCPLVASRASKDAPCAQTIHSLKTWGSDSLFLNDWSWTFLDDSLKCLSHVAPPLKQYKDFVFWSIQVYSLLDRLRPSALVLAKRCEASHFLQTLSPRAVTAACSMTQDGSRRVCCGLVEPPQDGFLQSNSPFPERRTRIYSHQFNAYRIEQNIVLPVRL